MNLRKERQSNIFSIHGTGTLSMFITFIVGVSSLPSVGATLTWREFNFVQSKLGWVALLTAVMHDGLLGWGFSADDYAVCSLPSGAQVSSIGTNHTGSDYPTCQNEFSPC